MRVIVTGDRRWYCPDLAEGVLVRLLRKYGPNLVIVHGDATGIDRSFAGACADQGVEQEAYPARWDELDHPEAVIRYRANGTSYNANAGPIRKAEMVAAGADMCVAFHRAISASKGTKDCVSGHSRRGYRRTCSARTSRSRGGSGRGMRG